MAFAAVVQILCEGNVPCPAGLFWPGMLLTRGVSLVLLTRPEKADKGRCRRMSEL